MYKLVIIDDEYYTLEGMKKILDWEKYGIEISGTASDGTEGLDVIRKNGADIVIADLRMREMDGLEMIEILRKDNFRGKIIILSGYQAFSHAQRAIDYKVEKYLTKPVDPLELEKTIVNVVKELDEENASYSPKATQIPRILEGMLAEIDKNYTKDVRLSELAEQFFCNATYVSKLFKKYLGENYIDYVTKKRIDKAKKLLIQSDMSVDEIMWEVGYQDTKHFRAVFKKLEGVSPSEYRKMNK